jgi:hypothetical protein
MPPSSIWSAVAVITVCFGQLSLLAHTQSERKKRMIRMWCIPHIYYVFIYINYISKHKFVIIMKRQPTEGKAVDKAQPMVPRRVVGGHKQLLTLESEYIKERIARDTTHRFGSLFDIYIFIRKSISDLIIFYNDFDSIHFDNSKHLLSKSRDPINGDVTDR